MTRLRQIGLTKGDVNCEARAIAESRTEAPPPARRFLDAVRGLNSEDVFHCGYYVGNVYRHEGETNYVHMTITDAALISRLISDGILQSG